MKEGESKHAKRREEGASGLMQGKAHSSSLCGATGAPFTKGLLSRGRREGGAGVVVCGPRYVSSWCREKKS